MGDLKWCPRGKHHVPRSEFGSNINTHDGLQTYCLACTKSYRAEYRERKRREREARNLSWQRHV